MKPDYNVFKFYYTIVNIYIIKLLPKAVTQIFTSIEYNKIVIVQGHSSLLIPLFFPSKLRFAISRATKKYKNVYEIKVYSGVHHLIFNPLNSRFS